jgi:ADP-ribosylglycohydrolase
MSAPGGLLQEIVKYLPDSRVRDRITELSRLPNDLTVASVASRYGSSGYVADSVPLALYAARLIDHLPLDAILRETIEAGGDTDTIASMTGQIVGASIGASQISRDIIESLPASMEVKRIAGEFAATVQTVE